MFAGSMTAFKGCLGALNKGLSSVDKRFRLLVTVATLSFAAVGGPSVAKADTFDFTYTGLGISAVGTLTATMQAPGQYTITGITGTRNGSMITALLAPGTFTPRPTTDNTLYFPGNPAYLDNNGFAYAAGGSSYNPVYANGTYYEGVFTGNTFGSRPLATFTVSARGAPAPVPGGGLLSFLALAIGGLAYCRKKIASWMHRVFERSNLALSNKRAMRIVDGR